MLKCRQCYLEIITVMIISTVLTCRFWFSYLGNPMILLASLTCLSSFHTMLWFFVVCTFTALPEFYNGFFIPDSVWTCGFLFKDFLLLPNSTFYCAHLLYSLIILSTWWEGILLSSLRISRKGSDWMVPYVCYMDYCDEFTTVHGTWPLFVPYFCFYGPTRHWVNASFSNQTCEHIHAMKPESAATTITAFATSLSSYISLSIYFFASLLSLRIKL